MDVDHGHGPGQQEWLQAAGCGPAGSSLEHRIPSRLGPCPLKSRAVRAMDDLAREATAMSKLSHPNVVQMYGAGLQVGMFITLQHWPGPRTH